MFQTSLPLLSLLVWLPILGGFACLMLGDARANAARWLSLLVALAALAEEHGHDDHHAHDHGHAHTPHESPWVVTVPLILLAIPSVLIGFFTAGPMLFGKTWDGHEKVLPFFLGAIDVSPAHDVVARLGEEVHGAVNMALHSVSSPIPTLWFALGGFLLATLMYVWKPDLPAKAAHAFKWPIRVLENKYGMDDLWIGGFAGGGLALGRLSNLFDRKAIDGLVVNGSARAVDLFAGLLRKSQTGYLYHYAFAMILGLIALLGAVLKFWH